MAELTRVVLSLGSNIEDRLGHLKSACELIAQNIGPIDEYSHIYDTPPMGFEAETTFLNMCLQCQTALSPEALLERIHTIEQQMGRIRLGGGYTSRTIDIDIVFYGNLIRPSENPVIPHPSYHLRKFVLTPLNDLDTPWQDPVSHLPVDQLLQNCPDDSILYFFRKKDFLSE